MSVIESIKNINSAYYNSFVEKLNKDVESLINGYYFFDNAWDMECCFTPYSLIKGAYNKSPNGDPEWIFQFCRLEWLTKYILLYRISLDEKLLTKWYEAVYAFFTCNNSIKDSIKSNISRKSTLTSRIVRRINNIIVGNVCPTYRTLDTAIRNYSLLASIASCETLSNKYQLCELYKRLHDDALFTYNGLREFDKTSNWGIIIVISYLICNILLSDDKCDYNSALAKLHDMLKNQVMNNGAHIEASNMYHNQILIFLLRLIYWSDRYKFELPAFVYDYSMKMADYTMQMAGPDGYQLQYGDSDKTSLNTLLALSSAILKHNKILPYIEDPDFVLLQEFDFELSFNKEESHVAPIYNGEDGVIKASMGLFTLYVYNSEYHSSHKHADNGSFILYYKQIPVIIDSGRFSYQLCDREYFKKAESHSTIVIGEQNISSDEYCMHISGREWNVYIEHSEICIIISYNTHQGKISRIFRLLEKELYIEDIFNSEVLDIPVSQYIIISPQNNVDVINRQYVIKNEHFKIYFENDYMDTRMDKCWISPNYNNKIAAHKISSQDIVKNSCVLNKKSVFKVVDYNY